MSTHARAIAFPTPPKSPRWSSTFASQHGAYNNFPNFNTEKVPMHGPVRHSYSARQHSSALRPVLPLPPVKQWPPVYLNELGNPATATRWNTTSSAPPTSPTGRSFYHLNLPHLNHLSVTKRLNSSGLVNLSNMPSATLQLIKTHIRSTTSLIHHALWESEYWKGHCAIVKAERDLERQRLKELTMEVKQLQAREAAAASTRVDPETKMWIGKPNAAKFRTVGQRQSLRRIMSSDALSASRAHSPYPGSSSRSCVQSRSPTPPLSSSSSNSSEASSTPSLSWSSSSGGSSPSSSPPTTIRHMLPFEQPQRPELDFEDDIDTYSLSYPDLVSLPPPASDPAAGLAYNYGISPSKATNIPAQLPYSVSDVYATNFPTSSPTAYCNTEVDDLGGPPHAYLHPHYDLPTDVQKNEIQARKQPVRPVREALKRDTPKKPEGRKLSFGTDHLEVMYQKREDGRKVCWACIIDASKATTTASGQRVTLNQQMRSSFPSTTPAATLLGHWMKVHPSQAVQIAALPKVALEELRRGFESTRGNAPCSPVITVPNVVRQAPDATVSEEVVGDQLPKAVSVQGSTTTTEGIPRDTCSPVACAAQSTVDEKHGDDLEEGEIR